jgi:DNA-binding NarL/FixJ family response regulator
MGLASVRSQHLYIISDSPVFSGELADLWHELSTSYIIHVSTFLQQWSNQVYSRNDIVIFDLLASTFEVRLEQLKLLRGHSPDCNILITGHPLNIADIKTLLKSGANGYMPKDEMATMANMAIQTIQLGICYLPVYIDKTEMLAANPVKVLPARELQVLIAISQGLNNAAIAAQLYISVHTVQTYRKRLFKRFNVNRAATLMKEAISSGLL